MSEDKDIYGLSPKQRRYVERLIVDFDEKAACDEAGFDYSMIPALKTHPLVLKATTELNALRVEKLKMTQDEAEIHLKAMAEPCFDDFYAQDPETGKFKVRHDIAPEHMAAIKEIRTLQDGTQTIVFYNKETLLDKVMRKHGAYVTKHRIEGQIDHKHTHEIDTKSLIEEMNQILLKRPKQVEVIDVDADDSGH